MKPVLKGEKVALFVDEGRGFAMVTASDDGVVIAGAFVSLRDLEAAVAAVKKRRKNGK